MMPPSQYEENNSHHRRSIANILEQYGHLIKWNPEGEENVFELGCGAGDLTVEVLVPFLPKTFNRLLATDADEAMVAYAKANHQHDKVEYARMDFLKDVRPELEDAFDHVFSFHCMHHLSDYGEALRNINKLLKPGGTVFITMMVGTPHWTVHDVMGRSNRWAEYSKNCCKSTPAYFGNDRAADDFRGLLVEADFDVVLCELQRRRYEFENMMGFKDHLERRSPFMQNIPEELKEDYWKDYFEIWNGVEGYPSLFGDDGSAYFHFNIVLAIATKLE